MARGAPSAPGCAASGGRAGSGRSGWSSCRRSWSVWRASSTELRLGPGPPARESRPIWSVIRLQLSPRHVRTVNLRGRGRLFASRADRPGLPTRGHPPGPEEPRPAARRGVNSSPNIRATALSGLFPLLAASNRDADHPLLDHRGPETRVRARSGPPPSACSLGERFEPEPPAPASLACPSAPGCLAAAHEPLLDMQEVTGSSPVSPTTDPLRAQTDRLTARSRENESQCSAP